MKLKFNRYYVLSWCLEKLFILTNNLKLMALTIIVKIYCTLFINMEKGRAMITILIILGLKIKIIIDSTQR